MCRTLMVASLLLSVSNPVFILKEAAVDEEMKPVVLLDNGAWSFLQADGQSLMALQKKMVKSLDTLTRGGVLAVPLIDSAQGKTPISAYWRYGSYSQALDRIEELLAREGATQLFVPVMRWAVLRDLTAKIEAICKTHPNLEIMLLDFTRYTANPGGLERPVFTFPSTKPEIKISCLSNPAPWENSGSVRVRLTLNGSLKGEFTKVSDPDSATLKSVQFVIPSKERIAGSLSRSRSGQPGPFDRYFFSFINPGLFRLLHAGSDLASLAALGKPGYTKSIRHTKRLSSDTLLNSLRHYNLVFLSNAHIGSDKTYPKLLEYVRAGGTLVISLGSRCDIPKLNRGILVPAKMGYAGSSLHLGRAKGKTSIQLNKDVIKFGESVYGGIKVEGRVSRYFKFTRDQNARVVLSSSTAPLLLKSEVLKGHLYLWTTDLDNLEWTTLGFSAFLPLFFRSLLYGDGEGGWPSLQIESDSLYTTPVIQENPLSVSVLTPKGRPFHAVRKQFGNITIGPFPEIGLYRLLRGADTALLAVNLAVPPQPASSVIFFTGLKKELAQKIKIISLEKFHQSLLSNKRPLWRWLLAIAALFLLLEGLIILVFSKVRT